MLVADPVVCDLFDVPTCARCCRAVDRFSVDHDLRRNEYVLHAQCHGETHTVTFTFAELMNARDLGPGVAFAGLPALPERA